LVLINAPNHMYARFWQPIICLQRSTVHVRLWPTPQWVVIRISSMISGTVYHCNHELLAAPEADIQHSGGTAQPGLISDCSMAFIPPQPGILQRATQWQPSKFHTPEGHATHATGEYLKWPLSGWIEPSFLIAPDSPVATGSYNQFVSCRSRFATFEYH